MLKFSRWISTATAAIAVLAMLPEANAQCVTGGAGGTYGTNTAAAAGVWDVSLPGDPLITTLNVASIPPGATVLNSVVLRNLTHTWVGDTHVVLQSPGGAQYNVAVFADSTSPGGGGCADAVGPSDLTFVDSTLAGGPCGGGGTPLTCGSLFPTGTYLQSYSTWTSGSAGLLNTPLEQIPIATGTWTLYIYDWYPLGDNGSITNWELCFGSPTPPPSGGGGLWNCVTGGAGGAFPASGAVDGTWPTVLPTGELSSTLAVTVPSGATKITALKLNGLNHTWLGDCQITLTSPAGVNYNIFQQVDGVFAGGCGDDFNGDYAFVDPAGGTDECGNPALLFSCGVSPLTPGAYQQYYGLWNSGDAGIVNVGLESIPIASGNWTVRIYDWYVPADGGTLASWELCFDAGPSAPVAYCTAGTSSNGCSPVISATAQPSASLASSCVLNVANVEGQKSGLIFYGIDNTGFVPFAWGVGSTSFLCVKAPTQRMPAQNSGGTNGSCNGSLVQDWNSFMSTFPGSLGNPFSAGDDVYAQAWYRDPPAPKTTNLSGGLQMTLVP